MKEKRKSSSGLAYRHLEEVIGCKWSVSVLKSVAREVKRPGALERDIEGISTKVLTERLRKLTDFGLIEKQSFPEVPPRTEYSLTDYGRKVIKIIDQIGELDMQMKENQTALKK